MNKKGFHINKRKVNRIATYLKSKEEEMQSFLKELVQIETPSFDPEKQEEFFHVLQKEFQKLEFETIRVKGKITGGYLYARPKYRNKSNPCQLLIGHCDTVWPEGTLKKMHLKSVDGKMSGPGVYDMKAGLTQIFFAIQAIKELQLKTSVTPLVLINSDEEIGSRESTNGIQKLAKLVERAFILEPPLGLSGKIKTARKGIGRFNLLIKGKAAHAGLDPGKGASAIEELSHQIQQLFSLNDPEKGISVNVGMIEGGISANVVAPQSKAVIDVRVLSMKDADEITKRIYSLKPKNPEITLEISGGLGRPPMEKTKANQKLWRMAKKTGFKIGLKLEEATAGGGSDGNTTSQFTATLDGLGTNGDGAHAAHEFIFIDKLIERTLLLTLLVLAKPINLKKETQKSDT